MPVRIPSALAASSAVLLAACSIPGGAAWSDLHASAFGAGMAAGAEAAGSGVTVNDSSGAGFDFRGDFALERDTAAAAHYGARVGFAPLEVAVSQFGYDGTPSGAVSGVTRFAGIPVSGSFAIAGDVELAVTKLTAGLDLLNTPLFRLGVLAGVDYVEIDRFDLIAREAAGGVAVGDVQTILEDESSAVPILGLRADARIPFFGRVSAEASGLQADFDDADVSYFDVDLAAHWEPWKQVELLLGYRAVSMDVEGRVGSADLDVELDLDGPYLGLSVYW